MGIKDWCARIITGPMGWNSFVEHEMVITHGDPDVAIAEWVIHCLANPENEGAGEVLDAIRDQRLSRSGHYLSIPASRINRRNEIARLLGVLAERVETEVVRESDLQFEMFRVESIIKEAVIKRKAVIWQSRGGLHRVYDNPTFGDPVDTAELTFVYGLGLRKRPAPSWKAASEYISRLMAYDRWSKSIKRLGDGTYFVTYNQARAMRQKVDNFFDVYPADLGKRYHDLNDRLKAAIEAHVRSDDKIDPADQIPPAIIQPIYDEIRVLINGLPAYPSVLEVMELA